VIRQLCEMDHQIVILVNRIQTYRNK